MKKRKLLSLLLVGAMTASILAGCGGNNGGNNGGNAPADGGNTTADTQSAADEGSSAEGISSEIDMTEDPYTVAIQVVTLPGTDYSANEEAMESAINAITLPEINCNVDIQFVWISEVGNTTSLAIAGGEKLDLIHVATVTPLSSMVGSDMLYDMNTDNLLQNRGAGLVSLFGELIETGNVNGQQLAVPGKVFNAVAKGIDYNKSVTDALGIEVPETGTMDDFEQVLYQVAEGNPDIMPFFAGQGTNNFLYWLEGYMGFGNNAAYGAIIDESNPVIENLYASDMFKDYAVRMNKWRNDGIIQKDSTDATPSQDYFNAQQLFCYTGDLNPQLNGNYAAAAANSGFELGTLQLVEPKITNSSTTEYMWGIAANSERPEKAMDFLNFLYTNTDVANILMYGLEGTNYEFQDGSDRIVVTNGSYMPNFHNGGNQTEMFIQAPNGEDYVDQWNAITAEAETSTMIGYMFNDADYQTESAAITNVITQYLPTIQNGACGTEEETTAYVAEFVSALEAAGINDVIAGNQAQLDAYLAK